MPRPVPSLDLVWKKRAPRLAVMAMERRPAPDLQALAGLTARPIGIRICGGRLGPFVVGRRSGICGLPLRLKDNNGNYFRRCLRRRLRTPAGSLNMAVLRFQVAIPRSINARRE